MKHCINKHVIEFKSHFYHSLGKGWDERVMGTDVGMGIGVVGTRWECGQVLQDWWDGVEYCKDACSSQVYR